MRTLPASAPSATALPALMAIAGAVCALSVRPAPMETPPSSAALARTRAASAALSAVMALPRAGTVADLSRICRGLVA
jgi:hypothetical protein